MGYSALTTEEVLAVCSDANDDVAWGELLQRLHPLIGGVALRTARRYTNPTVSLIEDLVQDIYLKLCRNRKAVAASIRPERPEAFFGFVKVTAANLVHDHFRTEFAGKRGAPFATSSLDDDRVDAPITDSAGAAS